MSDDVKPGSGGGKRFTFTITEPLMGYVTATRYTLKASARSRKYGEYKKRVRLIANAAGVPGDLKNEESVGVYVTVRWKKRQRIDASNIQKAIEDSLWKRDRRILYESYVGIENTGTEDAQVCVWFDEQAAQA